MTAPPTIGIDVGGTKILGVVLGPDDAVEETVRVPTPAGGDAVVAACADVARGLVERVPGVAAVGAGVPGLVDRDGVLHLAPNLAGVVDLPVQPRLEELLALPVEVDNDATCAAWAEHRRGAAVGADDVLMVTLGTGIGGGWIAGGRLQRGAHGFAGEIGHMVVQVGGPLCVCGRRGCWEAFASGRGLGWLGREAAREGRADAVLALAGGDAEAVVGEHVTAAVAAGDAEAHAVFDRWAWWVALGLANLVLAVDPSVVVLGGGVVTAGTLLAPPVRAAYADLVDPPAYRPPPAIVTAVLGEQAGAIGAALLARDRL